MRAIASLLIILSAGLLLQAADSEKKTDANIDQSALQGTWTVTQTKGFKADTPADELKDMKMTIKEDQLTVKYGDKTVKGTYCLDATATPRKIDVTVTDGPAEVKDKTFKAIYVLEGNVLHIAFRLPGDKRPSEFITRNQEDLHEVWFKKAGK